MSTTEVTVFEAGADDRAEWERFTSARTEHELGHLWEFQDLLVRTFRLRTFRLIARAGADCAGVLPLVLQQSLLGRFLTSVPYLNYAGMLGSDPRGRQALAREALALARRLKADRLELRGRDGADLPIEVWSGKHGYELELPGESAALWDALGAKVRAQVKRPRKAGYTARLAGPGGRRSFYPLLARRWHELGSPVLPSRFFDNLEGVAGSRMEYVLVERESRPVAAGVLVHTGARVEIPWAASAVEHNRYGVNMLLYWTALERAVARGARWFDFGRSTPGTGNASFKLQWGARERPLSWNVHLGSTRGRSAERGDSRRGLVTAVWRRMPAFLVQQLGPVLAARIPL